MNRKNYQYRDPTPECHRCGRRFNRTSGRQRFCGVECRRAAFGTPMMPREERKCVGCGEAYFAVRVKQHFCRPQCRWSSHKNRKRVAV